MQQNKNDHRSAHTVSKSRKRERARESVGVSMKIFIAPSQDKCDCIKQLSAVA